MKVYQGIIKKIPTHDQFDSYIKGDFDLNELTLLDTVQHFEKDGKVTEYINIRLKYKELDNEGNEKYIYNAEVEKYERLYKRTPILRAYGKEMRILLEIGEYAPVKVVVSENKNDDNITYNVICIQDQRVGKPNGRN